MYCSRRNSEKTRVLWCKKSVEIDRPSLRDATHRFLPLFLSFYPGPGRFDRAWVPERKKKYPLHPTEDKIDSILPWFSTSQRRLSHKSITACRFSLRATRLLRVIRLRLSLISFTHLDSILTILSFNFQGHKYFYFHLVLLFYCDNNGQTVNVYIFMCTTTIYCSIWATFL